MFPWDINLRTAVTLKPHDKFFCHMLQTSCFQCIQSILQKHWTHHLGHHHLQEHAGGGGGGGDGWDGEVLQNHFIYINQLNF